jgi:hypothetical protein
MFEVHSEGREVNRQVTPYCDTVTSENTTPSTEQGNRKGETLLKSVIMRDKVHRSISTQIKLFRRKE